MQIRFQLEYVNMCLFEFPSCFDMHFSESQSLLCIDLSYLSFAWASHLLNHFNIERGKNTLSSLDWTFILLSHSYLFPLLCDAFHLIDGLKFCDRLCVCVICPMICLVSSLVIVHILFRGISASFVPWMLADQSIASASLKYTTTEYKQQGRTTVLILVDRTLLHLAEKWLTAQAITSGIRKDEASLLVLSLCYWSSIRMLSAELVPQATDWMAIFFIISSEAKNFSRSHSLCKEHAKHCLSSGKINGYNCSFGCEFQGRAGPCDRNHTECAFGGFVLQRWLTSSFMHINIISNFKFNTEILLLYRCQLWTLSYFIKLFIILFVWKHLHSAILICYIVI